jgi:hypothetical protein
MEPLKIKVVHGVIEFLDIGPISKWIGPSLRGLLLEPLKDDWCELSADERVERKKELQATRESKYCLGCQKNPFCRYGRIFEADRKLIDGEAKGGRRNGLVALTIGGRSTSDAGNVGNKFPSQIAQLRLMAAGYVAIENIDGVMQKLICLGQEQGIAPDRSRSGTRFRILNESIECDDYQLDPTELPCTLDSCPGLCSVELEFESPFMIKETNGNSKNYTERLDFESFFSHCHRTVRRAVQELHSPQWTNDRNFQTFFEPVGQVSVNRSDSSIEEIRRRSNRQKCEPWNLRGVMGRYQLSRIPRAFVPWITWAGMIGIGDSRNCGMGCFHVRII